MPYYRYKARDTDGKLLEGQIEAATAEALAAQFQAGNITPVSIEETAGLQDLPLSQRFKLRRRTKVKLDDLILFCRQMYTLTGAGVPITRALRGLVDTARNQTLGEALDQNLVENYRTLLGY